MRRNYRGGRGSSREEEEEVVERGRGASIEGEEEVVERLLIL